MMPFWAEIMLLKSPRARRPEWHIRQGWNFLEGFRTRCGKTIPEDAIEWPTVRSVLVSGLENDEPICEPCKRRLEAASRG